MFFQCHCSLLLYLSNKPMQLSHEHFEIHYDKVGNSEQDMKMNAFQVKKKSLFIPFLCAYYRLLEFLSMVMLSAQQGLHAIIKYGYRPWRSSCQVFYTIGICKDMTKLLNKQMKIKTYKQIKLPGLLASVLTCLFLYSNQLQRKIQLCRHK